MKTVLSVACIALLPVTVTAQTTVYHCADPRGQPVFSDHPCGGHEQLGEMHGLSLDKSTRQAILAQGFCAWGTGINA